MQQPYPKASHSFPNGLVDSRPAYAPVAMANDFQQPPSPRHGGSSLHTSSHLAKASGHGNESQGFGDLNTNYIQRELDRRRSLTASTEGASLDGNVKSNKAESNHEGNGKDDGGNGIKRRRIQQACRSCGIKRVKCDGQKPCSTCLKAGEHCEYGQPKKRGPPKGSTRGGSKAAKKAEASASSRAQAREAAKDLAAHPTTEANFSTLRGAANSSAKFNSPDGSNHSLMPNPSPSSAATAGLLAPQSDSSSQIEPRKNRDGNRPWPPLVQQDRYSTAFSEERKAYNLSTSLNAEAEIARSLAPRAKEDGLSVGIDNQTKYQDGSRRGEISPNLAESHRQSMDKKLPPLNWWPGRDGPVGGGPLTQNHRPSSPLSRTSSPRGYARSSAGGAPGWPPMTDAHSDRDSKSRATGYLSPSSWGHSHPRYQLDPATTGLSVSDKFRTPVGDAQRFANGSIAMMKKEMDRKNSVGTEEDPSLDPLLWMDPNTSKESYPGGVTLTRPYIPELVLERLWTVVWGIVHAIWPILYKPSMALINDKIMVDPEKHPLVFNAACALAALTWDSGKAGFQELDADLTQGDRVERTASAMSVGGIGIGASPQSDGGQGGTKSLTASKLSNIFFVRAKYYLLKSNNEPSLEAIQALVYMSLRESGSGRAYQAASYQNSACRMALDLGMHRRSDFSSTLGVTFTHAEEQARRRAFWCCYVLDKTTAATLGRPPQLRDVEIDCALPNVDEADEWEIWANISASLLRDSARESLMKSPTRSLSHHIEGIKLAQILEKVISMYNVVREKLETPQREQVWDETVLKLHNQLVNWEKNLPAHLDWKERKNRLPNVLCLNLWYHTTKVVLHRPYILKQPTLPGMPSSHQECTSAVGEICDILCAYEANFGMRKLSSTFVYCIFTACTIEIANTTSTDGAVALEAKRRLKKFMGWLSRISYTHSSASHHLQILEQLGHRIDADLDGTGLDIPRPASVAPGNYQQGQPQGCTGSSPVPSNGGNGGLQGNGTSSMPSWSDSERILQVPGASQGGGMQMLQMAVVERLMAPPPTSGSSFSYNNLNPEGSGGQFQRLLPAELSQSQNQSQAVGNGSAPSYVVGSEGVQKPKSGSQADQSYGWQPNGANISSLSNPSATVGDLESSGTLNQLTNLVDPDAFLRLHDTSYWGAMPLSSEDPLSWASFTSSYVEALNGISNSAGGATPNCPTSGFASSSQGATASPGAGGAGNYLGGPNNPNNLFVTALPYPRLEA
ncbi:hypothetical protein IE53DRAFT_371002 [Violaceomyces palustris]|uniref:Uncharacterized protein n=1 Tax=Violaceomyces palustris TaxID=1673888 RepID=A0ACD0NQ91_9BASI|nr:hypothetical protein IE53DRAFT_371002 [Violaceomyces palustris]